MLPDAPGCISAGGILDEARRMATEARALDVAALPDAPPETPGFPE
ncbi:type II toxin-antitoxin system HicB family antitoxin [Paremcibacter congregatus]